MADSDSVAGRLKEARFQTAARLRETVSGDRMAELVGTELGKTMHPTQWRRYEAGTEPPLDVIRAVARVSGLSEAYIAFGIIRPPDAGAIVDPERDRKLTDAEVDRASRKAREDRAKRTASARKQGRQGRGPR